MNDMSLGAGPGSVDAHAIRAPRAARIAALALPLLFLAIAWRLLPAYGPTWDVVCGEYPQGEQYLAYLTSFDASYLDFEFGPHPHLAQPHLDYSAGMYRFWECHQLGGILSAISCKVFFQTLGLLPCVAAHNLPIAALVALLVFVLFRFALPRLGLPGAIAAVLALVLSPRFFAEALSNLKDAPETCLYTFALLAYFGWREAPTPRRAAILGLLAGLALAQKLNAVFLPVHALLFLAIANAIRKRHGRPSLPLPWKLLPWIACGLLAGWIGPSPMFWQNKVTNLTYHLHYFWHEATLEAVTDRTRGLLAFLWTTPPAVLALAALGALSPRIDADLRVFLLLGVAIPIGRTELPGAVNFDGVRHFLEFYPCLALLAGAGVAWLLALFARARPIAAGALVAALFAPSLHAVVTTHPHGICYFNALVGGLEGAQKRGVKGATDYWAGSYWQGFEWLSAHAEPGAMVLVPVASHVARADAPLKMRGDLAFAEPGSIRIGAPLYVMFITREEFFGPVATMARKASTPVFTIEVQGGTILEIHRFTDPGQIAAALRMHYGLR